MEEQTRQMGKFGARLSYDNVRAPRLGETDADYEIATGRAYRRAVAEEGREQRAKNVTSDPYFMAQMSQNRLQADRMHQMDLRNLDEKIAAREDSNDLLRLQLANSNSQFERELAYRQEESRRDRTASLIGALSNLGAAFVI